MRNKTFSNNLYIIKLIWKASPLKVILHIGVNIMQSILDFVCNIYFLRTIMEIFEKNKSFSHYVTFVTIILIFGTFRILVNSWYFNNYNEQLNLKVQNYFNEILFKKATKVELSCYENPDFYNKYKRATDSVNSITIQVMNNIGALIGFLVLAITVFFFIWSIDPWVLLFGICPIIASYLTILNNKTLYQMDKELTQFNRRKEYVRRTMFLKDFSKELKMTNIYSVLAEIFNDAVRNIICIVKKYGKKIAFFSVISSFFTTSLAFIGGNLYAAYRFIILHNLAISEFAVLITALNTFNNRVNRAIGFIVTAHEHSLYIENIKEFFEYNPKMMSGIQRPGKFEKLVLNNINFKYENSEKNVLNTINITINKGEKIAFVGQNGAGKSTLVKLLMRLYDVSSGEILYNDVNIKEFDIQKYRLCFGTVFQDYQILSFSIAENILMDEYSDEKQNCIINAINKSDVADKIYTFENGIQTTLTKEFDNLGEVMSGGEYQKIAIARLFAKDFEIAILDEPSSSLDPIAEFKMYESLMNATKDKTVIYISHRLSSATLADKVYLIEHGEVIESGHHTDLMKINGRYAKMFNMQAEKYKTEDQSCE